MLGGHRVGVDDLLGADLVRVLVVLQVLVRHVRRRVVDAADLAFLADLHPGHDRVNRRRRIVDVGDRTRRRHRLQVLVVHAVRLHRLLEPTPVVLRWDADAGVGEQLAYLLGLRLPNLVGVLCEELTGCVLRVLEALETLAAFLSNLHGGADCVVGDGVEVHVGEVQRFFGTVVDVLACQVAVQVHLAQTHGVAHVVAALDRRHRADIRQVGDGRQTADRHLDRLGEVRGIHGLRDVERTQVAGDVLTDMRVRQVVVVGRGLGHLQDLRAQVRHGDATLDRVRLIHRVLEDDVGVAGLELDLRDRLEEATRVDLLLVDTAVIHHLVVLLRHRNLGEGHAVHALHVVGAEQVHVLVLAGQLERDVRDDDAQGQRLNTDLLVSVLTLRVQETEDVRVVGVQVHSTGALTRAQLVGVGEGILQQLHDGNDARGLVLDVLDRGAHLAKVGQQQRHAPATLG